MKHLLAHLKCGVLLMIIKSLILNQPTMQYKKSKEKRPLTARLQDGLADPNLSRLAYPINPRPQNTKD
jgi:hypothetical protein